VGVNIFISYRREDMGDLASHLAERLIQDSRVKEVFTDVSRIPVGVEFDRAIEQALRSSDAILILIGSAWRGERSGDEKKARIFDDEDVVRREVRLSLNSGRIVIPVLRAGTVMPAVRQLPSDLERLSLMHAFEMNPRQVKSEAVRLVNEISRHFSSQPQTSAYTVLNKIVTGFLSGVAAVFVFALGHNVIAGRALETTFGGAGNVWGFVVGFILICVLLSILRK